MLESNQDKLELQEIPLIAFKQFLHFIYTDSVEITADSVVDLLVLASEYVVPRLVTLCEAFVSKNLTPENVCELWMLADKYRSMQLWQYCKFFVNLHFDKLNKMKETTLATLTPELLQEISKKETQEEQK